MVKEKCNNCQKKEIETGSEGVYLGDYQGNGSNRIHACYTCYESKESEYLKNYAFIYSYSPKQLEEKETGYVKTGSAPCYANKKDQNGEILRQADCRHCQPWKFPNDNDIPKQTKNCFVCDKDISSQEVTYSSKVGKSEKDYCSLECMKKATFPTNNPQQNPPSKSPNSNKGMATETKIILGIVAILLVFTIGLIGTKIYKRSRKKKS